MAIITIGKHFIEKEPDYIFNTMEFIRQEYHAQFTEIEKGEYGAKFKVEGDGIPCGNTEIDIIITMITPESYVINIAEK